MSNKNIRNFAIIAHIDHGKSTLADRFLELTSTIAKDKLKEQFLDQNPISRERGITIKLAPVRMKYQFEDQDYILDLIDTPGHMDFSYEVSRTLAACEGAILLVDATKGIQAQTVAHYNSAKKENLVLIPVINKIDLESANTKEVAKDLVEMFGFSEEEIFYISAKSGENVESLLQAVITKIPAPIADESKPLRALVFDAVFDEHRGVIIFTKLFDGKIKRHQKLEFIQSKTLVDVSEVGFFSPFLVAKEELVAGEIGYIVTGIKDIRKTRVGDTITTLAKQVGPEVIPLPGYEMPKPMVFFGVYPKTSNEYVHLREALNKLSLNDGSMTVSNEYSAFLGSGFRVGFLGLLHAEIVKERLSKEEGVEPLLTMPRVLYEEKDEKMLEPYMKLTIFAPATYVGAVMTVAQNKKGSLISIDYHKQNAVINYEMPYSMFIRGLSSELKSVSQGFASLDYEIMEYREANLIKMDVLINDNVVDVLSELVYKDEADHVAREKVEKLKEHLPKQQFRQVIQASIGATKVLARTEISPYRKDVLAKMSGGDRTRKDKLLEAQKKGKSKLINVSKVEIPQKALLSMLQS